MVKTTNQIMYDVFVMESSTASQESGGIMVA